MFLTYYSISYNISIIMSKMTGYDTHDDGPGFVGIRFCQECNNMLYPKEDKENKVLMYAVSIR